MDFLFIVRQCGKDLTKGIFFVQISGIHQFLPLPSMVYCIKFVIVSIFRSSE